MKKNLKYYIKHYKNFINNSICEETIENLNNVKFEQHMFYNNIKKEQYAVSGSKELHISYDTVNTTSVIMNKLSYVLKDYLLYLKMPWFNSIAGYSGIRFNKYEKEKTMALHCDHIHDIFDGNKKGIPILSILGLLNDNFEGGEFIIFDDYKIKLKKGDILIFPSIFLYPHKVNPVTKGTRYSFISWAW
jgi:hypothetical protein